MFVKEDDGIYQLELLVYLLSGLIMGVIAAFGFVSQRIYQKQFLGQKNRNAKTDVSVEDDE